MTNRINFRIKGRVDWGFDFVVYYFSILILRLNKK